MRILLDTQCWLWMLAEPERFSEASRRLLIARENELFFSAASAWEISMKYDLGRLTLPAPPAASVPPLMAKTGVTPLPVLHEHALAVAGLPPHHRDPFDRLLVAQARVERLPILSADRTLEAYDVEILRA